MKAFNWAIIGTGRIANTVAKEITKTGRHKIVSVFSRTKSRAEDFAKIYNAKVFDSIKEAVLFDDVDAVYIATPHSVHYKIILECLNYKKPILCEKSFTINHKQAEIVLEKAEKENIYLCEAMWSRFNPVVKQIDKWIAKDEIGEIKQIKASFALPLYLGKSLVSDRIYKKEYAGGALLDLGVYPIAYAHQFLGIPHKIICSARMKDGVDYNDDITLEYQNSKCKLNCSFDKLKSFNGIIKGTKGFIISPIFYKPKFALMISKKGIKFSHCKRGYIYEFDGVADDVRKNKIQNAYITHKDTIEIMKIMDECRIQNNFIYPKEIEKI